jgi:uncharacterized membrane protein
LALLVLLPISILIALPRRDTRRNKNLHLANRGNPIRRLPGRNPVLSMLIRCGLLTSIVLALAGMQTVRFNNKLAVAFLIDASDSIGAIGKDQATQYVRDALRQMRLDGNDQAAVVVFGADAQIERSLSIARDLPTLGTQVRAGGSNIDSAIRLGLSLLPSDAARRIVLISDGKATAGDADAAARLVRAANARLDVVPMKSLQGADAAIERVETAQRATIGQTIPLNISVRSNTAQRAQLTVYSGPDIVSQQVVDLAVGLNQFAVRATTTRAGYSAFRVQLTPERDTIAQNNTYAASVIVAGPPRVLIVNQPQNNVDETTSLKTALTAAGINYEETTPRGMPSEIQTLSAYQALVLVNVPARELSVRAMTSIQSYVRDIGGGLVAIGGPNSFGVGGYFKTPLEDTLPIESQVKDPKRFPSVAMMIVMDKSGSMGIKENGVEKMRIADEAAARVAEMANDDDELTVMAFDTTPVDVIGPFQGRDRARNIPRILQIATGGGGIYVYESLQEAYRIIRDSQKLTKFVILLSDGNDSEHQPGSRELVRKMRDEGIVLTVVAIGDGSDISFLKDIARIGEGRYHFTDRASNLPTIFTEETAIAQRSYIVEDALAPKIAGSSPIMNGISSVPPLLGYIAASPKPSAQVILKGGVNEDPILSAWQYGLGRSVAFTSDATGRWGKSWVTWSDFPKFWAQAIRWTVLDRSEGAIQARVTQHGDQTTISAELPATRTSDDIKLTATVIDSEGQSKQVELSQVAPGRFEAEAALDQSGAYFVRVAPSITTTESLTDTSDITRTAIDAATVAWVKPYSPEYLPTNENGEDNLKAWAQLGGGGVLVSPAQAFDLSAPAAASRTDLSMLLMTIAIILLPFDIGIRRIAVSLRKLIARILGRDVVLQMAPAGGASRGATMAAASSRLMSAKQRTSQTASTSSRAPRAADMSAANRARAQAANAAMGDAERERRSERKPQAPTKTNSAATTAELLKRKRKQQDGDAK